ncbi:MAG: DUF6362 family protein [Alphaproteobacteria bacterium]|nr:DUF6362 family protein [Alphaproteobacteria bacterium]
MGSRLECGGQYAQRRAPRRVISAIQEHCIWSVVEVQHRLEDAGRTLMALPLHRGALPADCRSRWPEVMRGAEDAFAALVGAGPDVKQDFASDRLQVRITPSARAVGRMDEVLDWLWYLEDARKRRLCLARALVHPVSDRHVVSYRKLGRIFGLHHDTVRIWHDRALSEIAQALSRDGVDKSSLRKPRRSDRRQ